MGALAEGTEEVYLPYVDLRLRHRSLLCILHLDKEDDVALAVPPPARIDTYKVDKSSRA